MLSKPFRSWLILLLLGPTCALALEIGEIQITSSLNQIFDAKIPLPGLTQEELAKVSVKLAPAPMFKEFGLDRSRALGKLVFSVEYNATGEKYVRVVSTEPIREPSLGLLLEFSWPRGKTFREFTVFLDPVQRAAKQSEDRTKTVLDTPPTVAAAAPEAVPPPPIPAPVPPLAEGQPPKPGEPAAVVPPVTAATALPPVAPVPPLAEGQPLKPDAASPPTSDTAVTGVTPDVTTTGESPPLPIESPLLAEKPAESAGASVSGSLKAGGSYGPVKPGEGLLGIALKVRPDPGITREEMAQALFRANPQAFSKAGINGLKIGSVLRIPTLQEIGGSATSLAARPVVEGAKPAVESTFIDPMIAMPTRPGASGPDVFPLPAPVVFKPVPVPVTVTLPTLDPKVLKSVPAISAITPKAGLDASKPGAATSFDAAALSAHVAPPVLEPVSVTPMLFLAVSEVISSAVQIPAFAIPAQIAPGSLIAETASSKPGQQAPEDAGAKASEPSSSPPSSSPAADATPLAPKPSMPLESRDESDAPASQAASAKEDGVAEAASKPATTAPASEAATPPPAKEPTTYKGGEQYGPVAPNERLWDIAVKVRPDPSIGKDVMLKALLMANPQAFAKTDADQMKKGAVLHIPTLQEIVKHTSSPAAKQLLEQQGKAESPTLVAEPTSEAGAEQGESASATQTSPTAAPTAPPSEGVAAEPVVETSETPSTAAPVTSPDSASTKAAPEPVVYKGGEQYGPVAPNERLWDIAFKVRPDPSIGKEVMMKALFMANPQAFAKTDADQMKKGAVLRIPTLQEIVKHTGSPAAKQLLEQQASGQPKPNEPAQSPAPVPSQ